MAQIIKRGKMWYSDYRQDGHRIMRRLSPFKEKAQTMLDDLLAVKTSNKDGTVPSAVSLYFFEEKYLTWRKAKFDPSTYYNDERAFRILHEYGRRILQLAELTPEYLDDLWLRCKTHKDKPLSNRTISGHIRRLKTAMHRARRWKLAPMQDWGSIKCLADRKRKDYLSYPDFKRVLEACEGPYHRATMLLGFGGLRRGELLNLQWEDIDFKTHLIKVQAKEASEGKKEWAPKGSEEDAPKEREVDMTTKLEAYLKKAPGPKTGLVLGRAINEDNFTKYYRDLGAELGVKLFPHKFRHTCASFLISTGSTLDEVGEILGQTDPRSKKIYAHMEPRARRHAVDRMQDGLDRQEKRDGRRAGKRPKAGKVFASALHPLQTTQGLFIANQG